MLRDVARLEAVPLQRIGKFSLLELLDLAPAARRAVTYRFKNHPVVFHEQSFEKVSHPASFS